MRTLSSAVYFINSYNNIILSISKLFTRNTGEQIIERERERERESFSFYFGLYFLAIVVFLVPKIVGSMFAKYNLECKRVHVHAYTTIIAFDSRNS